MLLRIMAVLLANNFVGKTELALKAKVQYKRLVGHIEWLKERKIIEMIVTNRNTVSIALTEKGRDCANVLFDIFGLECFETSTDVLSI